MKTYFKKKILQNDICNLDNSARGYFNFNVENPKEITFVIRFPRKRNKAFRRNEIIDSKFNYIKNKLLKLVEKLEN